MKSKFLKSKSAQRSTQEEQARQKGFIFESVGLPCVEVAWNGGAIFSADFENENLILRQKKNEK